MRYVILHHTLPDAQPRGSHYDLMLDAGTLLRTWALDESPQPGRQFAALPLAPHRRDYLTYEGPVSGNRGSVARWDAGECLLDSDEPDKVVLRLAGAKYSGRITLQAAGERWAASCE